MNARNHAGSGEIIVLLVDSEAAVTTASPSHHLQARPGDEWDLAGVCEDHIHLMVQTMETWIVADPDTLQRYYGHNFNSNPLPQRDDLESVGKDAVADALRQATRRTSKGEYHKISHASDLLKQIDPTMVRRRCAHCERLFDVLSHVIGQA